MLLRGAFLPPLHQGHIEIMQVLGRGAQPQSDGRACVTPRISSCSANIGGAAGRGAAPAGSPRGWIPPLPPQTSVQMLTGVARLGFRYERQRVRVELLGKRHRESQSLIGIPARDERPRLPVPARAERGHWSRAVKATHRRLRGRAPHPGDSQLSRLGLSLPTSLLWGSGGGENPCPCTGWSSLPGGSGV